MEVETIDESGIEVDAANREFCVVGGAEFVEEPVIEAGKESEDDVFMLAIGAVVFIVVTCVLGAVKNGLYATIPK